VRLLVEVVLIWVLERKWERDFSEPDLLLLIELHGSFCYIKYRLPVLCYPEHVWFFFVNHHCRLSFHTSLSAMIPNPVSV
jgi:hypothetical protein